MAKKKMGVKAKNRIVDTFLYILLVIISIVWVIPVVFTFMTAFRAETGMTSNLLPNNGFTIYNFLFLLGIKERYAISGGKVTMDYSMTQYPYLRWVLNTLIVSVLSTIISTSRRFPAVWRLPHLSDGRRTSPCLKHA